MVKRICVEKKFGFNVEAESLKKDLMNTLNLKTLENVRIINIYDLEDVNKKRLEDIKGLVLSEPNVDMVTEDTVAISDGEQAFRIQLLPGQYDQRADSAGQCIEIITLEDAPTIVSSKMIVLKGVLDTKEMNRIKNYLINPVESREVSLDIPTTLKINYATPDTVETVEGFIELDSQGITLYKEKMGFAMTAEDLAFVREYFKNEERRNPTITELKVIDTYWSDHCRHTTFLTAVKEVNIEDQPMNQPIKDAYAAYLADRDFVYEGKDRRDCLMDIATINMKSLRKKGELEDLDVSEEINACSIEIPVDIDGKTEPWLLMFKNETHNHPTEIEPFGGAATCLGGAIRDPLSGRSYVYHSMRVTGAADPTVPLADTIEGKLPQKVITQQAAAGFSSYGNQIGLATGMVSEVYDPDFVAKRMEVGAVVGAAPKENVVRERPTAGDIILLVGGRTGRDGIGGATGSSKEHDEESLTSCGAEVQKGNPPVERKIQRLFRIPALSKMIKRCNDFGAGGVSVAIGELADSLEINLDAVKKKYEGLDGTEIAISESQERMAVVIAPEDVEAFKSYCHEENLEVTHVADVTDTGRLIMKWQGKEILNLSRVFLDTNGVQGETSVHIEAPKQRTYFNSNKSEVSVKQQWLDTLNDLNVCSQKGLVERFDNTIGSGTVLMPFGGMHYSTPIQAMVAKIPVLKGETKTGSMMSYGYDPQLAKWSPFHGALYAVVDAIAKILATGGDYQRVRLSLQEYFEKLGDIPEKWGKPYSALLGASYAQTKFKVAAIGGKDSMSGTFKDIHVPPTLIAFAVTPVDVRRVITPELKRTDSTLVQFYAKRDAYEMVDFDHLLVGYNHIYNYVKEGRILSSYAIGKGGICAAISKMAFGNGIGVRIENSVDVFEEAYGSILLEVTEEVAQQLIAQEGFMIVGETKEENSFEVKDAVISISEALASWESRLESIFPTVHQDEGTAKVIAYYDREVKRPSIKVAKPRVFIPAFPGTNCEVDTYMAFEKAGAVVETMVFKNLNQSDVVASLEEMVEKIKRAQIVALPGGFSAGDEPEGSGKFIASVLRNPKVAEEVMKLLNERDGLMLGICNGFQALIKLGLLPYGEIRDLQEDSPTLTFNKINRHVSRMASVKVASVKSPWLANEEVGNMYETAFSHGEGRFYASTEVVQQLIEEGQVATQYVDKEGLPTYDGKYNINGSVEAIEGITSPDGRIFGKMGHVERVGNHVHKNVYGKKDFKIFQAGVNYFR
ncbi:phosphoribosylformylglycinamidine synthase PurL [Clostridium aceticum]|uniref:Phosphoribosylformylglycinamidine synthase PurL n=1 Tax=Clostridium aceticum TaxID=84022 RepID=A0A0D8ICQ3_9CLOT|nr:phosphoribosylformylglycinamidine synthase [Clostridium aceticum]AKL94833.1 phosphoribosylformylglycinamidine synthase PurL [Clostridium aceticum]KJF27767.1 phosphoribosylformylglycinamidine synthase [Clostridium aceticum]